ncbi:MAG: arsenite methyltransferase [Actinobacteria bacterium]|nr:arsenite methyltransferase [Actinomycetota bacterium]
MTRSADEIKEAVRDRYARAARQVRSPSDCCGPAAAAPDCCADDPAGFGAAAYQDLTPGEVPDAARLASLGCGNPTAIAGLQPGQRVLDLGSGGGLDVFLAARQVGPTGFVYGLDMTDEMLDLARANQQAAGVSNVAFVKGEIEAVPLPDACVDVVISNCVINLSADKPAVFREAHRVLAPGGRLAVSDIVALHALSDEERADLASWAGCIAGAITAEEYSSGLAAAGFRDIAVTPTHPAGPTAVSARITATA